MAFETIKTILAIIWICTWASAIWMPSIRFRLILSGVFALLLLLLTEKGEELNETNSV